MQKVTTDLRDIRSKVAETEERLLAATDITAGTNSWRQNQYSCKPSRFHSGAVVKAGDALMDLFRKMNGWVVEVNAQSNGRPIVCYKSAPMLRAIKEFPRKTHPSAGLPRASTAFSVEVPHGVSSVRTFLPLRADRDCSNSMARTAGAWVFARDVGAQCKPPFVLEPNLSSPPRRG